MKVAKRKVPLRRGAAMQAAIQLRAACVGFTATDLEDHGVRARQDLLYEAVRALEAFSLGGAKIVAAKS